MVKSWVVACFPASLAGLGNQGKSKEVGVALFWRVRNSSPIFLRSASFFAKSRHAIIRAVMTKTSWWGGISTLTPKQRVSEKAHVIDFGEWVDSPGHTVFPPLVGPLNNILRKRGKN